MALESRTFVLSGRHDWPHGAENGKPVECGRPVEVRLSKGGGVT